MKLNSGKHAARIGHQQGFTLVELAIVVVIIALLLVGILGGQTLINSAKAKDVIATADDLRVSINYFKQRYKYLPGDWPFTAGEIVGVTAGTTVGTNGDGYIDGSVDATGAAQSGSEVAELPFQLFSAGFLGKINAGDPQRRIQTSFGAVHVVSKATAESLVSGFAAANPNSRNAILFNKLPCEVVREVDAKLDEGDTLNGHGMGTACSAGFVAWYALAL